MQTKTTKSNRPPKTLQEKRPEFTIKRLTKIKSKTFKAIIAQENHCHLAIVIAGHNPLTLKFSWRSPDRRKSRNYPQNRYSRSNNQNNQYGNNYSKIKYQ